jgi:putative (di)nucleoside polyphosphate hydrolase
MIDSKGFRANVGIILSNGDGRLFWGKRAGMNAWQFPQGGIKRNEPPENALYRELFEETGLESHHVEIIGTTAKWLRYRLPRRYIRYNCSPVCIGQKQKWYLLRLLADESRVNLSRSQTPEFDSWRWIEFWRPVREVVGFKRRVYRKALGYFEPMLFPGLSH